MVLFRPVRHQFQGGEDFRQEQPVAQPAADQIGVLARETQAGALGRVALQQGPRVGVTQRDHAVPAELPDEIL